MTDRYFEAVKNSLKKIYGYNEFKIIEEQKFKEILNLLNNNISIRDCEEKVLPFLLKILIKYDEIEKKDAQEVGYFPKDLSEYRVSHFCGAFWIPTIKKFAEDIYNKCRKFSEQEKLLKEIPEFLHTRYEELIKAINNSMPLSFFWLAGSIIEGVLCEYCKKNNIKPKKYDIDGYITELVEKDKTIVDKKKKIIPEGSAIYTTLQYFRQFRNTIHPNNVNNDHINGKNLQNYKEHLDDVIKYFCNDNQSN